LITQFIEYNVNIKNTELISGGADDNVLMSAALIYLNGVQESADLSPRVVRDIKKRGLIFQINDRNYTVYNIKHEK